MTLLTVQINNNDMKKILIKKKRNQHKNKYINYSTVLLLFALINFL